MAWVRERLRAAGEVSQLAEDERDLGLDKPVSRPEANVPSITFALGTHEHEVADSGQPELLADTPLRRLHRKGVGGAAAVAPEMDPARQVLAEMSRGTNAFVGSTKGKRSVANRPEGPYGRLRPTRPGEYLLLDTTTLANAVAAANVRPRTKAPERNLRKTLLPDDLISSCDGAGATAPPTAAQAACFSVAAEVPR